MRSSRYVSRRPGDDHEQSYTAHTQKLIGPDLKVGNGSAGKIGADHHRRSENEGEGGEGPEERRGGKREIGEPHHGLKRPNAEKMWHPNLLDEQSYVGLRCVANLRHWPASRISSGAEK